MYEMSGFDKMWVDKVDINDVIWNIISIFSVYENIN